jgi:hypothetical protein
MKHTAHRTRSTVHAQLMNRIPGIFLALAVPLLALSQGGDQQLRTKADALFTEGRFAEAYPLYSQLVSLSPSDRDLNYRLGATTLYGGDDKEKAIGHLKYACESTATPALSWYFLGRSYHLAYRFKEALAAYEHYRGTADKKVLAQYPVDALEQQCRNGQQLLSNLKEITVHNKVEVAAAEFFRFYDLGSIGGKIVVTPEELRTSLDKKSGPPSLIYLPDGGGALYFSSLGKDGRTGRDIYRTELLPTGQFAEPSKLAGYVNTDQDEDHPFLAHDGKSFYFSSKGHNSMGGYDVFRTSYDKGLDVFGAPENMDFAVNTPDDDILYIVDPEGKEACFASGRSSHQGMLHVYRVSTTQIPINITVLKGTFASELDPADRKAHIRVEDALTRERVADIRTDINGGYVLALPRSGRYKFVVEAGPTGRTHVGHVEVPRSDVARAYRQEMSLVKQADQEKLMIRNYFEEPLGEDLIALALDEIKRRAQLNVSAGGAVAQQPAAEPAVAIDVMTAAGFTGDITKEDAVKLAETDAREQTATAADLKAMSDAAYTIALENAAASERHAQEASSLVAKAEAETDEERRNALMTDAARTRQASRTANLRARAAYATGQELETERLTTQRTALAATKTASDLSAAFGSGNDAQAAAPLKELKSRLDVKNGPDGTIDAAERTRRAATELDKEAARVVQQARTKNEEETELVGRIGRLKRDQEAASGKSKKEQMGREIAGYEQQLGFLREEVLAAQAKARAAEQRAEVARGEALLTRHLSGQPEGRPTTEFDAGRVEGLGQLIAGNESRIDGIGIDERYDALIAEETTTTQRDAFNWQLQGDATAMAPSTETTLTAERTTEGGADRMASSTASNSGSVTSGTLREGQVPDVPVNNVGGSDAVANVPAIAVAPAGAVDGDVPPRTSEEVVSMRGVGEPVTTTETSTNRAMDAGAVSGDSTTVDATFVEANELAELKQLRDAERNKTKRDSLEQRISALEQRMRDEQALATRAAEQAAIVPAEQVEGTALLFSPTISSADLTTLLFPDHNGDRDRIANSTLEPRERALSLHGLELMLVDSIDAETARQLALLEQDPAQADVILPRVERLRSMKEERIVEADRILEEDAQRYAATETMAMEQALRTEADQRSMDAGAAPTTTRTTPHVDRYVSAPDDVERIYESVVEHRSPAVKEAVAEKDRDMEQIADLNDRIDSMETVLEGMPAGREQDKLRDRTDKLIDQEMVLRTDLGQRMAFLSREEYKAGVDSLNEVTKALQPKGISPSEPLAQLVRELEGSAKEHSDKAKQLRKTADDSEDIVKREALYRDAYQHELLSLRDLDKAMTVSNHMLSDGFVPGKAMDYTEVEERFFGTGQEPLAQDTKPQLREEDVRMVPEDTAIEPAGVAATTEVASAQVPAATGTNVSGVAGAPADGSRYQRFLATDDPDASSATAIDASVLSTKRNEALAEARRLEQRSLELSDQALAVRDSAGTAKKRDRERLEREALRLQALSDSLHEASLGQERLAQDLDVQQRDMEESVAFAQRLDRYYYLGGQEQLMILSEADHSRYFMARTKALEQQQQARTDRTEAEASRQLADTLLKEATTLLASPDLPDGRLSEQRMAQAKQLSERSVDLLDRADSLSAAAARLQGASDLNDRQAAILLQGLSADRSTAIMALEQRTRRTDALLAESRALVAQADDLRQPEQAAGSQAGLPPLPDRAQASRDQEIAERSAPESPRSEPVVSAVPVPTIPDGAFRVPAVLTEDLFGFRTPNTAAPPILIDQQMPAGVVYKVQIGAFKNEIPKELFSDMTPVMGETTASGVTRYTAGLFSTPEAAEKARGLVRERGYRDAFVVAYDSGNRVSMAQAQRSSQPLPAGSTVVASVPVERPAAVIQAPVVQSALAPVDDAQVLASYPATAEALLQQFAPPTDATSYYNDPTAAPARQVETVKGLFFTVQVGVYSKPTALDKLFNITPLNSERTETNKIRYTTGVFLDMDQARGRKDQAVTLGVKDAFITAYLNGKRIPMRDARALLQKFGPSVLADPALATP